MKHRRVRLTGVARRALGTVAGEGQRECIEGKWHRAILETSSGRGMWGTKGMRGRVEGFRVVLAGRSHLTEGLKCGIKEVKFHC